MDEEKLPVVTEILLIVSQALFFVFLFIYLVRWLGKEDSWRICAIFIFICLLYIPLYFVEHFYVIFASSFASILVIAYRDYNKRHAQCSEVVEPVVEPKSKVNDFVF